MADNDNVTEPLISSGNSGRASRLRNPRNIESVNYGSTSTPPGHPKHMSRSESVLEEPTPVTLSWENINVSVLDKKSQKSEAVVVAEEGLNSGHASFPPIANGHKQILKNVTGVVKPGSLLAILGASGAGKSTLMNVMTNRNVKGYMMDGIIRINGMAIGSGIRNISAYVQQDDLFFSTLTVRETLTFRAMLRMDQSIDKKARLERVEEVIAETGLSKCADSLIGGSGQKKGISGGESRRLSFACEMLTNPPLLFCDEPTSGLDSYMALNVIQMLLSMAQKNRTILCTIHQPSSEIFAMFDQLLLLAEGRVAYMGPTERAVDFFQGLDYSCPRNFNPADFYIMNLAVMPGKEEECQAKVNTVCDAFRGTQEAKDMQQTIDGIIADTHADSTLMEEAFRHDSRYEASWGQQFLSVFWRSWVALIRNSILFRVRVMQTVLVSVVLGVIYLRLDVNQRGVMNINGAIFVLIINSSMSYIFAVVNTFPAELPIFLREYGSGLYRTDVYFVAKNLAELPSFVILPAIFISIGYWMIGLNDDWQAFLIATGIIVLVSNVSVSFGLLISTLAGDVNIALAVAPPLMIPLMMFGGFFLNNDSVPVYFIWLKYLSWFLYSNEYLMVNQWDDYGPIACELNGTETTQCQYKDGKDVLRYLSFSADNNWLNLGLLIGLFVGFRIFAYIFLFIRARRSKT